jgi:hypothetical protein
VAHLLLVCMLGIEGLEQARAIPLDQSTDRAVKRDAQVACRVRAQISVGMYGVAAGLAISIQAQA